MCTASSSTLITSVPDAWPEMCAEAGIPGIRLHAILNIAPSICTSQIMLCLAARSSL